MRTFALSATLAVLMASLASLIALTGCGSGAIADATKTPTPSELRQVSATAPVDVATEAEGGEAAAPKAVYQRPRTRIRGGGVKDIDFDYLGFEIEADADFKDEMLTEQITELDGKPIILRGFILDASIFTQKGIKEFVLIRDNQECCFGPGAKVCHNVWVNMDEGQTTDFSFRPVEVHGKFSIRLYRGPHDGKVYSVYHLQASKVKAG